MHARKYLSATLPTEAETPRPKANNSRLEGLDFARFVALAGMVIVNFNIVMTGGEGDDVFAIAAEALQGRAAAVFVVLAGIGLGLGGARYDRNTTLPVTLRRSSFLLIAGLLNTLIFEADIIHYYAFYFLFGAALLRAPGWALTLVMFALVGGFVVMAVLLDYDAGWDWKNYIYTDIWTVGGFLRNLFFNGWHPVFPWLAFVLFGILLSRMDLGDRAVQRRLTLGGAGVFALSTALSIWLTDIAGGVNSEAAILFSTTPVPPMPLYMCAGAAAAGLVIGMCLLMERPLKAAGLLGLTTKPGRQTLTLYFAHIVIGMGTLDAFGMLGGQTPRDAFIAAVTFCLLAAVYAHIWAYFFNRGPLESLMRKFAG